MQVLHGSELLAQKDEELEGEKRIIKPIAPNLIL
jgi:hypothetical protein